MMIDLLNKILILILFLSILNIVRHTYFLIQAWVESDSDEPKKYILNKRSLFLLGMSISYVLLSIFYGIQLN